MLTGSLNKLKKTVEDYPLAVVTVLLAVNFLIRIFIYYNTKLFCFSDYQTYLNGVNNIAAGNKQYLLNGNFLFAISYIGYFAKYILGSIDYFFILNCLLGTLTSLVIFYLVVKISKSLLAGIITIILHTIYTEFMVFSSVFYSPVIMVFLLSLFLLFIYRYLNAATTLWRFVNMAMIAGIFVITFFFKPELKYFPWFLLLPGLLLLKKNRSFSKKILLLSFLLSFLLSPSTFQHNNPSCRKCNFQFVCLLRSHGLWWRRGRGFFRLSCQQSKVWKGISWIF